MGILVTVSPEFLTTKDLARTAAGTKDSSDCPSPSQVSSSPEEFTRCSHDIGGHNTTTDFADETWRSSFSRLLKSASSVAKKKEPRILRHAQQKFAFIRAIRGQSVFFPRMTRIGANENRGPLSAGIFFLRFSAPFPSTDRGAVVDEHRAGPTGFQVGLHDTHPIGVHTGPRRRVCEV